MEAKQFFIVLKRKFLVKKKLNISVLGAGALLLLSACGRSDVTSHSTGLWERLILMFGKAIQGLSFGGSIGLGIIIFTILIRAVMIPLYNRQIKSSRELQELQPELRRLQSEYPGRENREALAYAQQDLYKDAWCKSLRKLRSSLDPISYFDGSLWSAHTSARVARRNIPLG